MGKLFEKIRNYYRNSPKRIGSTWFLIHLFLLVFFVFDVWSVDFHQTVSVWDRFSTFVSNGTILFGGAVFGSVAINTSYYTVTRLLFCAALYYALFIFVCFAAKNTSSKKFLIAHTLFSILFILNLALISY